MKYDTTLCLKGEYSTFNEATFVASLSRVAGGLPIEVYSMVY